MTLIVYVFPKLRTAKDVLREMSKKPSFRAPFDSHIVKGSQTLLEFARQHFDLVYSSLWGRLSWEMSL